jgi:PhnB protein
MPKINTYLSFDGTAAEAMRFYEEVLGARLDGLMKFGEMLNTDGMPPGSASKVMHAQLSVGDDGTLMASDQIGGQSYQGMKGLSIALSYESADEARRVFDALGQRGMTIMPLQPSFFAEIFGMLIDRFGVPWTISGGSA